MYQTKEIADRLGIHPNTVRIYEEWGFISPAPRLENGYRIFSDIHLFQLKIARTLFKNEIIQENLRHQARQIVYASGSEDFILAEQLTKAYLAHLQQEHKHALHAITIVEKWLKKDPIENKLTFSRKEVAQKLDITVESIRNWERNHLLEVPRLPNGSPVFREKEIEQLIVIRSLRRAHYSINAIMRLMQNIEQPEPNVIALLNTPSDDEDIVSVTDQFVQSLLQAIDDTVEALSLIREVQSSQK